MKTTFGLLLLIAISFSLCGQQIETTLNPANDSPAAITLNYYYTGSEQTWTVPAGVSTITIEAWGAQGGTYTNSGGLGGYSTGVLNVSPGQVLYIYVGQQPANYSGGFNGGGAGYSDTYSRGGGGASDIRVGGTSLNQRVLVAAGGGGATNQASEVGGAGGGSSGLPGVGAEGYAGDHYCGHGGTQNAGGAGSIYYGYTTAGTFGQGGNSLTAANGLGSGGGGGWYGGGGGDHGGGGGGSSYIGGVTSASTSTGIRSGNGQINITYASGPSISTSGTLSTFAAISGMPSASQSLTVSGSELTTDISITAPTGFEISLSSGSGFTSSLTLTQSGGTVSSTTIYVRMAASATGTPSGNITLASTGATTVNIAVSGTVYTTPSTQANNIMVANSGSGQVTLNWTNGNGSHRVVFLKASTSGTPSPVNGSAYSAGSSYGTGSQIGSTGWYCVYNGTGSSVTITNLANNTSYVAMVNEYNGTSGGQAYNNNVSTNNPKTFIPYQYSGNIQTYTVPTGVTSLIIEAFGASGGYSDDGPAGNTRPGYGARMKGTFMVTPGQVLKVLVGGQGNPTTDNASGNQAGGGGGGTFVTDNNNNPMIVAGGGGGENWYEFNINGADAVTTNTGSGGGAATTGRGAGGGGFVTNGENKDANAGGYSFLNGGSGGYGTINAGGFGGGGGAQFEGGGGGGYNGGSVILINNYSAQSPTPAGSYNVGSSQSNSGGANLGFGSVTFTSSVLSGLAYSGVLATFYAYSGTPSIIQNIVVFGSNLSNNIVVTVPEGFEISTTSGSGYSRTLSLSQNQGVVESTTLFVRLSGQVTGGLSGNIVISSEGTSTLNVALNGIVYTTPTTQASNLLVSNAYGGHADLSWTNGNGSSRIVFMKASNSGFPTPANGTAYTASSSFASGSQIASSGWYCVYNGTSNSLTVNGLSNISYSVMVLDYNGISGGQTYNNSTQSNNLKTFLPFAYSGNIQSYTVPNGVYSVTIEAYGASGGYSDDGPAGNTRPGYGARMKGTFTVTPGQVLKVLVGGQGNPTTDNASGNQAGGGGGGTFVTDNNNNHMLVAGGGGGENWQNFNVNGADAVTTNTGTGGGAATTGRGAGGGGFVTNGDNKDANAGGYSFLNGGSGGFGTINAGGFGGGGGAQFEGGGGGGYNGGSVILINDYSAQSPTPAGSYNGGSNQSNTGGVNLGYGSVSITSASTAIYASPASLSAFTSCSGTASPEQSFTTSGSGLSADISVTAPTGFELSTTSGGSFSSSLTLTQTGGSVASTTIYVRMAASATGTPSGNITLTSTGATTQNVAVSGTVSSAPVVNAGDDQTVSTASATLAGSISGSESTGAWSGGAGTYSPNNTSLTATYTPTAAERLAGSLTLTLTSADPEGPCGSVSDNVILSFSSSSKISIADGNWETDATWSPSGVPTLIDNVTVNHTVTVNSSLAADPAICNNLAINSGKLLTVASGKALTVKGSLTNPAGATITVLSDGSLITNGSISNNGTINIQRTITKDRWHLISSPVTDATAQVFENDYLQNWSEVNAEWTDIISTGTALNPAQGYGLWTMYSSDHTYTFTGTPNTGNQEIPLTVSSNFPDPGTGYDGANLLGNPYSSAIDWSMLDNTYGAVYYWQGNGTDGEGTYLSWNNGSGDGSQYIAPAQGFFVVAASAGTFSLTNAHRTHSVGSYYKSASETKNNLLVLETVSKGISDKLYVNFDTEASEYFDFQYDAYKFPSGTAGLSEMYSYADDKKLSIDVRPETELVQLGFANSLSGTYSIGISQANGIGKATLEDTKTNTFTDLLKGSYSFTWLAGEGDKRFKLHMGTVGVDEKTETFIAQVYAADSKVYVRMDLTDSYSEMVVYDLQGRLIVKKMLSETNLQSFELNQLSGAFLVQLRGDSGTKSYKIVL